MRRLALALVATFLLLTSITPVWAASLNFTGYIDAEIKYTPEDQWMGRTGLEITAGMSAANKYSLKLGFYDEDRLFWQSYSTWTFRPSDISLYAQGRLWDKGPIVKGTLGDFAMLGPVYMAGDGGKAAVRGVLVEDLPVGPAKLSGYWAWPRNVIAPLSTGSTSKVYGGRVNIGNLLGLKLDAYGAVRSGIYEVSRGEPPHAPDGAPLVFKHTNEQVAPYDGLHLFTKDWGRSAWVASLNWHMIYIKADGEMIKYLKKGESKTGWGPPTATSEYAYVIATYYEDTQATQWLIDHLAPFVGDPNHKVTLQETTVKDPYEYAEAVGAIEGSCSVAGLQLKGQVGRLAITDHLKTESAAAAADDKQPAWFYIASASTSVPLGNELATKPLTVTAEYRAIDPDFTPWARSTDPDGNRIEKQRGQQGVNLQLATTVLPANPVDFKVTFDAYQKGDEKASSSTVEMGTVLSGYEVSGKLGTNGTEVGVAKNLSLGVPGLTKVRPSYKLTLGADSSTKHLLSLSTEFSLGGFKGITAGGSYEMISLPGTETGESMSSAVTSISASYTAPNGWTLKAGWRDPDQEEKRDDTYVSLTYKVTL